MPTDGRLLGNRCGDARVVFDLDTHEDAIARVESRLPELPTGDSRTTLASGLDALLRG
jgi:hypothetical protein